MSYTENAIKMKEKIELAVSYLDDEEAESVTALFDEWEPGVEYYEESETRKADRVQYDELLYKCVQTHVSQSDWTPPAVPALWVRTSTEEWPEWIQPTGAHDAYEVGAKVSHNGKHWINEQPANVYEPGVWGWAEVE